MKLTHCSAERCDVIVKFILFTLCSLSLVISIASAQETHSDSFIAAVIEDFPLKEESTSIYQPNAENEVLLKLAKLQKLTKEAAAKGAKIIVFPENILIPEAMTRFSVNQYLEEIPNPSNLTWNPCLKPSAYNGTEIQEKLSCIARMYNIYLVANMGKKEPCASCSDSACDPHCQHVYSCNVVYSNDGTFIAYSHKRTKLMHTPLERAKKIEYVTFHTPFGKFASLIGFDILFSENMFTLLKLQKIHNVILPSEWPRMNPLFRSVAFYSMFARAYSINLIVAGFQSVLNQKSGSGLFTPNGAAQYNYELNREGSGVWCAKMHQLKRPSFLRPDVPAMDPNIIPAEDYLQGVIMGLMFHFKPLQGKKGSVGICIARFCCSLKYERQQLEETYALGVAKGYLQIEQARVYMQVCSLSKCEHPNNCITRITKAETIFNRFTLSGHNYITRDIGANVMVMNGPRYELNEESWIYNDTGQIYVEKTMPLPLHSAVIYCGAFEEAAIYRYKNVPYTANSIQVNPNPFVLMVLTTLLCV